MSDLPTIVEALSAVMEDVQAVGKNQTNTQQGYKFRGVDAVVNAVGPALRRHGVVVLPFAESVEYETYSTSKGTAMKSCVVKVRYVFYGPAGDSLESAVYGESSDAGDKSTPKAHSVAFRTALLQALCIPTDEADPDESSHERVIDLPRPIDMARLKKAAEKHGVDLDDVVAHAALGPLETLNESHVPTLVESMKALTPASPDTGPDGAASKQPVPPVHTTGPVSSPTLEGVK